MTLAQNVNDELEKIAKEKGLSKSAILTIAFEEYKKGQKDV
ncbi:CopG family transcriptional regulator [Staphylococcus aureus]|nr:CopG family transcriptional regulator [Staphylococcus aureus]MDM5829676.1 CopG family transcriptional regulator [Staphylococcus aureus]